MPWAARREGGITEYRFSTAHPVLGALGTLLLLALLGAPGVVLVGLGTEELSVTCEREPRDPAPICKVVDGYLLGAFPVVRHAVGLTDVVVETSRTGKNARTHVVLYAKNGQLEAPRLDIGGSEDEKRALGTALQAWLKGSEPRFSLGVRLVGPFAVIGAPFALIVLQSLLSIVFGLLAALFAPQSLRVDDRKQAILVRPRGFAFERQLKFAELTSIVLDASPGGVLGAAPATSNVSRLASLTGLHLHFIAHDGTRVVFRNKWRLPREQMERLRDDLAQRAGLASRANG